MKFFCYIMRSTLVITTSLFLFSIAAQAAPPTNCYNFEIKNSPDREENPHIRSEVWCYKSEADGGLFIYNSDHDVVKPELSMFVDQQGVITHASLNAGKISVHKVHSQDFNPFSVPFTEPKNLKPVSPLKVFDATSEKNALLFLKQNASNEVVQFSLLANQKPFATASYFPWRGYWWPRRGQPITGPLSKYDRYVAARSGVNPGSASWERANHPYRGVSWSGHCNGWAASAILRSEPRTSRTDPTSGVTFSVVDQKGILAEADYCVSAAFYGNRNRGGGNGGDIRPDVFHKAVLYYIGSLRKPLAMDYKSDASVDNHVISGYTMQMTQTSAQTFNVTATLSVHGYDKTRIEAPGMAPIYKKTYRYILRTDARGNPVSGSWLTGNPDFMWSPLSTANCQKLNNTFISQILSL